MERMGDIHGMARTYGNLASFYQARHDTEKAAAYVARAYPIFVHLGAAEAQQAAGHLVDILGSVEAANAYLTETAQSLDDPTTLG